MTDPDDKLEAAKHCTNVVRLVESTDFVDLLVSRRRLERVEHKPGWLRDCESDELFAVRDASDLAIDQRA